MTIGDDVKLQSANTVSITKLSPANENYLKMLEDLSKNAKIIFVSQNIDDPDLDEKEKSKIADEIFQESQLRFINRFGKYLTLDHLKVFKNSQNDEVDYMIKELETDLKNYHKNVRNRRYCAMKSMITKTEYFSEKEMMKRDPLLYEELIGQYLSASEKKLRDGLDMKNTALSEILLDQMENDRLKLELQKLQESDENNVPIDKDDNSSKDSVDSCESFQMENECFHKKWGEFEESGNQNADIFPGTSKGTKVVPFKSKSITITANEKEILRQEFISTMHSRFLNGEDKNFDYTEIDENSTNEDLKIQQQDLEDKYFDESSSDEEIVRNESIDDDGEDDLDNFMKLL